jgi:phosphate transport system protein
VALIFQRELEKLKKKLLALSALVEENLRRSFIAVDKRDPELARAVILGDVRIDEAEVEVEEECLKVLALHQPVAADLRFVVAFLKINNDLERIGDLAVNIAHKAVALAVMPRVEMPFDLAQMGLDTQQMLADSLDALVNADVGLAHDVCARDGGIDAMKHQMRQAATRRIREEPHMVDALLTLLAAARNLERIADHATNIAQDVIYIIQGRDVRHPRTPRE